MAFLPRFQRGTHKSTFKVFPWPSSDHPTLVGGNGCWRLTCVDLTARMSAVATRVTPFGRHDNDLRRRDAGGMISICSQESHLPSIEFMVWSLLEMSALDKSIAELREGSDISASSEVYAEIEANLVPHWSRTSPSSCLRTVLIRTARTIEDGQSKVFPELTLYLKYDEDFRQTGIDPRLGNWGDKWKQTDTVRDAVNAVLERHKYGSDYVSSRTFIFVASRERIAFRQIGLASKGIVRELVRSAAPDLEVAHIFWSDARKYHIIFQRREDCKRGVHPVKATGEDAAKGAAAADEHNYCRSYEVEVELGHTGMNLWGLAHDE